MTFKAGDLVRLKSGGPLMTVLANDGVGYYTCRWFAGLELKEAEFEAQTIEPSSVNPNAFIAVPADALR